MLLIFYTFSERKILRHFWDQKNLHKKTASFHIVVTSYQLIVTDFKYFNRIKWQYMILDEAQNSTNVQMKMILTRIGDTSKAIITGDTPQIYLGIN